MRQMFHPCTEDYIVNVCNGRCCQGTGGIMVTVHDSEIDKFKDLCNINGNFIEADERGLCPFKTKEGFCNIHNNKPFGCIASPFTLNIRDTLIIRNRYRLLRCYKTDGSKVAYIAHAWSLKQIVGLDNYEYLKEHLNKGGGDVVININDDIYKILKDNDKYKKELK